MSINQIPETVRKAFSTQGIKLDMLGQPLVEGDQILVKSYNSSVHNTIASIKRINPVNLVIDVERQTFDTSYFHTWQANNPNKKWWDEYNRDQFYCKFTQEISRNPSDVIKFDKQVEIAKAEYSKLVDAYPEFFV